MDSSVGLRVWVALGVTCLLGLLIIQVYWFAAAYSMEKQHLRERITLAVRDVSNRIADAGSDPLRPEVKSLADNRFELVYNGVVDYETLDSLFRTTFFAHDLLLPFELTAYNWQNEILFGNFYAGGATSSATAMCMERGLNQARSATVVITFPGQQAAIIGGMELWIFSASMFILVLGGALIMMVRLSRQKRRAEFRAAFISNMTHELHTPIANIAVASEVLKKATENTQRSWHYANIISTENQRLKSHLDQVLQTAMLEKGELALNKLEVNINEIVTEISSVFSERIRQRGGILALSIGATRPIVFADALHLRNMISNLLDNADKYSPDAPHISVRTEDHHDGVSLIVCDKGVGIGKEFQSRIFEKFFRASTGNVHDIKGFGLGLTYIKGIVEAHNGTVSVSSTPGEGSRFEVLLKNCA